MITFEQIEKIASKLLERTGQHTTQVIVFGDDFINSINIRYSNSKEKEQKLAELREYISTNKVQKYYVITEIWLGHSLYIRPSKDKDKQEALFISKHERENPTKSKNVIKKFTREEDKIVWGERLEHFDESNSRFNFFMEDVLEEQMQKARLDKFKEINSDENINKAINQISEMFELNQEEIDTLKEVVIEKIKTGEAVPKEEYDRIKGIKNDRM